MDTQSTIVEEDGRGPPADEGHVLLVMSPDHFNTVPLTKNSVLTIGRSTRADIYVEDRLASREHARLHVGDEIQIVDLDSANGTLVRDGLIPVGKSVSVLSGEVITIGNTVLMVQRGASIVGRRWLWSHAYFESRVAAECAKHAETRSGHFALVRLRFDRGIVWRHLAPVFARRVSAPHVFASYGPNDFEILLVDVNETAAADLAAVVCADLRAAQLNVRCGVANFPRDGRTVDTLLAHANALLRPQGRPELPDIEAPSMERVRAMAKRAAATNINILILGETGVGKEVLAQAIHRMSQRAAGPIVALNCPALGGEALLESELFGHEKGAFTGAAASKPGLLELADGGTVFLDEIGDMPLTVQAKLLRVLETREVKRLGSLKTRVIDVRFIAATNAVLEDAVANGTFRRDLFFRLNGISLQIPPLKARVDEIPVLAQQFLERYCRDDLGRAPPTIDEESLDLLAAYSWPGNIRELRNTIERAAVLCDGDWLLAEHLPLEKMESTVPDAVAASAAGDRVTPPSAQAAIDPADPEDERQRMMEALKIHAGNQTRAAAWMAMPRRTFVLKLKRYGIPRPQRGGPKPSPEVA